MMEKTARISLRIEPDVKRLLDELARHDERSVNTLIVRAIKLYLLKNGVDNDALR